MKQLKTLHVFPPYNSSQWIEELVYISFYFAHRSTPSRSLQRANMLRNKIEPCGSFDLFRFLTEKKIKNVILV